MLSAAGTGLGQLRMTLVPNGFSEGKSPRAQALLACFRASRAIRCGVCSGTGRGGVWPRGRARDSAQSPSITPKLLGGLQDSVSSAEQLFLPAGAAVMDCQGQSRLLLAPRCLPAQVRAGGSQILGQPRAAGEGVGLGEAAEHGSAREGIIWLWGGSGTVWGPGVLGSWIPGVPASRVLAWLPPFPEITACLHDCLQRHGAASAEARMD